MKSAVPAAALAFVLGLALGSRRPCADQTAAESIWAAAVRDPKFRAAMATGKADFAAGRASPFREFRRTPDDWPTATPKGWCDRE